MVLLAPDKHDGETPRRARVPTGILVSGLLIAVSFVAMIVPLALFHAAQVAAAVRLRTAIFLLLIVVIGILFLGIIGQQAILLVGGLTGTLWLPLFVLALHTRQRSGSALFTACLLCLPAALTLFLAFAIPNHFEFEPYLAATGSEIIARARNSNPALDPALVAQAWENAVSAMKSESAAYSEILKFFSYGAWQRLSWFSFGNGAGWFLGLFTIGLANLVFLDAAFEQVEKLRAVYRFVKENQRNFPRQLVDTLAPLGQSDLAAVKASPRVSSVERAEEVDDFTTPILSYVIRRRESAGSIQVWGHLFRLEFSERSWCLRSFALPTWTIALAIAFLGVAAAAVGGPAEIIAASQGKAGPLLAIGGLVSFSVICVLAVQGFMTMVQRLTTLALIAVLLAAAVGMAFVSINPHLLLGVLGLVGLLDYAYDFRGQLAKRKRAV